MPVLTKPVDAVSWSPCSGAVSAVLPDQHVADDDVRSIGSHSALADAEHESDA